MTLASLVAQIASRAMPKALHSANPFFYAPATGISYIHLSTKHILGAIHVGEPILCRLGFHKWQDYGKEVEIFWQEPPIGKDKIPSHTPPSEILTDAFETHHKIVHEGKQCKRCGIRLMRKFEMNSDGTLSSVGWELSIEEKGK